MTITNILFIILGVCAVVLTGFGAWFLYELIAIVRDFRETTKAIHDKVEEVGSVVSSIRQRLEDSTSMLSVLTKVISKIATAWQSKRSRKRTSSTDDEV